MPRDNRKTDATESITFACSCGRKFRTGPQHAGKRLKCSVCGKAVAIPGATTSDSPASDDEVEQEPEVAGNTILKIVWTVIGLLTVGFGILVVLGNSEARQMKIANERIRYAVSDANEWQAGKSRMDGSVVEQELVDALKDEAASDVLKEEGISLLKDVRTKLEDIAKQARVEAEQRQLEMAAQKNAENSKGAPTIPADVSYTLEDAKPAPNGNRRVNVELNRKVPDAVLRAIATELNLADTSRTFVGFSVRGQTAASYWATAIFKPNLEVRILGLAFEDEKALSVPQPDAGSEVIGRWLQDEVNFSRRISIFGEADGIRMEMTYPDGNSSNDQMVEKPSTKGRKFMVATRTGPDKDYYLIDSVGNLQIWSQDTDGSHVLALTARKLSQ